MKDKIHVHGESLAKLPLDNSWKSALANEFSSPYMENLQSFLADQKSQKTIYPADHEYFSALNHCKLGHVKAVIIGQDPYHGPGQAHGLSFSVKPDVPIPPSLANIYKELESDLGIPVANHGYLKSWSDQGVLLLNAVLSVEAGNAGSHRGMGWETFTDAIIARLNDTREHLAFVLWGAYAQKKGRSIDRGRHLVLSAPHPSPLSSYRGFFGSKPFSQINSYLLANQISPIDWKVPDEC